MRARESASERGDDEGTHRKVHLYVFDKFLFTLDELKACNEAVTLGRNQFIPDGIACQCSVSRHEASEQSVRCTCVYPIITKVLQLL